MIQAKIDPSPNDGPTDPLTCPQMIALSPTMTSAPFCNSATCLKQGGPFARPWLFRSFDHAGQLPLDGTIFDLFPSDDPELNIEPVPNRLVGHRAGHHRRCWGQVRLEYSGQMTWVARCNLPTATWAVRLAWSFRLMPVAAFRRHNI
jgi:hypothetical protein